MQRLWNTLNVYGLSQIMGRYLVRSYWGKISSGYRREFIPQKIKKNILNQCTHATTDTHNTCATRSRATRVPHFKNVQGVPSSLFHSWSWPATVDYSFDL